MENFILYLGKTSVVLTIFFLTYYLLLRKETFFNANRCFLVLGIITSLALPLLVFRKIIWVEPVVQNFSIPVNNASVSNYIQAEESSFEINWFYVIGGIYLTGVFFFFGKFTREILSLVKIISYKKAQRQKRFKLIDTDKIQSPFSFFNFIVFNSSFFKEEELYNIIAHEKVHSSQYHSVDILIGQLFCIFFWFNPFSWLHKKAIAQNLEFIADSEALKQVSNRITYQKTLLKVSAPQHCISITNHFYQSLIKKRIIMLNKNQSKARNSWKYTAILPVLILFMLQFQIETIAQEKQKINYAVSSVYYEGNSAKEADGMMVLSTTTEDEIKDYIAKFTKDSAIKLEYSGIKRNEKNEIIEISFSYDDFNGTSGNQNFTNSEQPISGILFEAKKDENGKTILKVTDLNVSFVNKNSYFKNDNDSLNNSKSKRIKTDEPVLIVVDGKVKGMSDKVDFPDAHIISSITVLKNDSSIEKYGNEGKNGVIEIVTKNATDKNGNPQKGENSFSWSTSFKTSSQEDSVSEILQNSDIDYKKAFIMIDGLESTPSDLEKLNPSKFAGSSLITGNEKLAKKYGKKALNGVIIIETVNSEPIIEITPQQIEDAKNFKINDDNDGFIIHKKSTTDDLEFYKNVLAKNDISFDYSKIKRNAHNEITNISIALTEKKKGSMESISWLFERKGEVISDIFIGKRSGVLIITDKKR